jgi:hypothetical protein
VLLRDDPELIEKPSEELLLPAVSRPISIEIRARAQMPMIASPFVLGGAFRHAAAN